MLIKNLIPIIFFVPIVLTAEVVKEFIDGDNRYFFEWEKTVPANQVKTKDDLFGKLSLYVQVKDAKPRLLFSEKREADYSSPNSYGEIGKISLVAHNGDIYYSIAERLFWTKLFYVRDSGKNIEKTPIKWEFGAGVLSQTGCEFVMQSGMPVLRVSREWYYPQDAHHEFVLQKDGTWLEISDGINQVFRLPKDTSEWDAWIIDNVRKRNEFRLKKDPSAVPYKMPTTKSIDGYLLDNPDKIDLHVKIGGISQARADRLRKILADREAKAKKAVEDGEKLPEVHTPSSENPAEPSTFNYTYLLIAGCMVALLVAGAISFLIIRKNKKSH